MLVDSLNISSSIALGLSRNTDESDICFVVIFQKHLSDNVFNLAICAWIWSVSISSPCIFTSIIGFFVRFVIFSMIWSIVFDNSLYSVSNENWGLVSNSIHFGIASSPERSTSKNPLLISLIPSLVVNSIDPGYQLDLLDDWIVWYLYHVNVPLHNM